MEHKTRELSETSKWIKDNLEKQYGDLTCHSLYEDDPNDPTWIEFIYRLQKHKCYDLLNLMEKSMEDKNNRTT